MAASTHRRQGWREDAAWVAALIVLAVAVVVAVDPRGRFPLNDDWVYGEAVRTLLTRGEIRLPEGNVSLLAQLLWGAGFAAVWGFSFEVLRASTLVLGLVALLALRGGMRELGAGPALASFAALVLLANPLFVVLAHTFMTDVPFLGCSMAALWLLVRGFERDSKAATAGGLLLAIAATFVRQFGLALLVGYAVATLVRRGRRWPQWIAAWAPLAVGFALLRGYEATLSARGALPGGYHSKWGPILDRFGAGALDLTLHVLGNVGAICVEVGLFAAPLAALWLSQSWPERAGRRWIVIAAAAAATVVLAWGGRLVPYFGNVALDVGCSAPRQAAGPLITLRDGCRVAEPGLGLLGFAPRVALTWIGLNGIGCVIVAAIESRGWRRGDRAWHDAGPSGGDAGLSGGDAGLSGGDAGPSGSDARPAGRATLAMVVATAMAYLVAVSSIDVFDRYVLFLVAIALILLAMAIRAQARRPRALSWTLASALALGSLAWGVGAAQEYMGWNRARWAAISYLTHDLGAPRQQIDGGFEYGGWVNYDPDFRLDFRRPNWWWMVDDRYAVAFAPVEGYVTRRRFPYQGWFGLIEDDIVALERAADARSRP